MKSPESRAKTLVWQSWHICIEWMTATWVERAIICRRRRRRCRSVPGATQFNHWWGTVARTVADRVYGFEQLLQNGRQWLEIALRRRVRPGPRDGSRHDIAVLDQEVSTTITRTTHLSITHQIAANALLTHNRCFTPIPHGFPPILFRFHTILLLLRTCQSAVK